LIIKPLLNAKRDTVRLYRYFRRSFVSIKIIICRLLAVGAPLFVCRKEGRHNQRFILTQMHRRRRQHNGTRNALCCHRRRPDNLHDFSVSAQQSASRIIHSSFDLDGRHSTASHSSGCTSTSVDPKLFLHLHQSRALFILRKRSALEILFHLVSPRTQTIRYIGNIHSHTHTHTRSACTRTSSFARAAHRNVSLRSSISRARDKSPRA